MRIRHCARFIGTFAVSGLFSFGFALVVSAETRVTGSKIIATHPLAVQYAEIADTDEETSPSSNESLTGDDYQTPEIQRDISTLPYSARRMHKLLVDAAIAGDVDKLSEYIGSGEDMTMLSLGGMDDSPIDFLKSMSGDDEGYEILAILQEVLEAGFVHLDKGTENEIYVWPYFYGIPIHNLDARQRVELYKLMTHGDFEEMKNFGAYSFYRVGITPEGRWRFFVAGD